MKYLKESIVTSYGKKGQKVVDMNNAAVDQGVNAINKVEIPAAWADAKDEDLYQKTGNEFVDNIMIPMNEQEGDSLPVSALMGQVDGTFPSGTAAYENAVLPSTFLNGTLKTASSATSAPSCARTLPSVRSC